MYFQMILPASIREKVELKFLVNFLHEETDVDQENLQDMKKFGDVGEGSDSSRIVAAVVAGFDPKRRKDVTKQKNLDSGFVREEKDYILMRLMGHIGYKQLSLLLLL